MAGGDARPSPLFGKNMSPTVARGLRLAGRLLARRGRDSPELSAQLLMAQVLGLGRVDILLERSRVLSRQQWRGFWKLVARRSLGEPVAYILERKEFFGREFTVGPAVLTPRPETEHLVEETLKRLPRHLPLCFADLGTGSGILAVTLALEYPASRGIALDYSAPALDLARHNAHRHGVESRLLLVQGDFARAPLSQGGLDLLLANPPYVSAAEYQGLSQEVTRFEPRQALVPRSGGGASGLEDLALILDAAAHVLRPGGLLAMELGCDQGAAAMELASQRPVTQTVLVQDLAGRDRALLAQRA